MNKPADQRDPLKPQGQPAQPVDGEPLQVWSRPNFAQHAHPAQREHGGGVPHTEAGCEPRTSHSQRASQPIAAGGSQRTARRDRKPVPPNDLERAKPESERERQLPRHARGGATKWDFPGDGNAVPWNAAREPNLAPHARPTPTMHQGERFHTEASFEPRTSLCSAPTSPSRRRARARPAETASPSRPTTWNARNPSLKGSVNCQGGRAPETRPRGTPRVICNGSGATGPINTARARFRHGRSRSFIWRTKYTGKIRPTSGSTNGICSA